MITDKIINAYGVKREDIMEKPSEFLTIPIKNLTQYRINQYGLVKGARGDIIMPKYDRADRMFVKLYDGYKHRYFYCHRLVALAFRYNKQFTHRTWKKYDVIMLKTNKNFFQDDVLILKKGTYSKNQYEFNILEKK